MTAPAPDAPRALPALGEIIAAALALKPDPASGRLDDGARAVCISAIAGRAWVDAPDAALAGRSVILLTRRPIAAALALRHLDGLAGRIVLCPPDLDLQHLPSVIRESGGAVLVHDFGSDAPETGLPAYAICETDAGFGPPPTAAALPTEWILFTSGTTGPPKLVAHDLAGLTDAMPVGEAPGPEPTSWATFYDIRRYGGLQMLLRALTGAHAMLLSSPGEAMASFIARAAAAQPTHVSGTPSHWRSALLIPGLAALKPRYVRLSGEIADQAILDRLAAYFPGVAMGHAFASTEAGVGFEVTDGQEGFPETFLGVRGRVEMKVEGDTLRIRSPRTAHYYLGEPPVPVAGPDGFVDTGDLVALEAGRWRFKGRANGVINVGGLKVHPEEVEGVINLCPGVRMSRVKGRNNPITGAIVTAEVVLSDPSLGQGDAARETRARIVEACRAGLSEYKIPASVKFVDALPITAGGKLERRNA